jgi:hypothetical protein
MENHSFLMILLLMFSFSCTKQGKFSKAEISSQEEAWAQMMEGHDVVMPLMSDIYQVSKELKVLAEDSMVEASDFHPRVQQALADLEAAEDSMMDWMAQISENPMSAVIERSATHQEVLDFIEKKDQSIQAVAKKMKESIQVGENLIQERQGQ